jgi:hypothetical protein
LCLMFQIGIHSVWIRIQPFCTPLAAMRPILKKAPDSGDKRHDHHHFWSPEIYRGVTMLLKWERVRIRNFDNINMAR